MIADFPSNYLLSTLDLGICDNFLEHSFLDVLRTGGPSFSTHTEHLSFSGMNSIIMIIAGIKSILCQEVGTCNIYSGSKISHGN